ncbi:MAG: TolC family protein [Vicinamibacterales bacterium]
MVTLLVLAAQLIIASPAPPPEPAPAPAPSTLTLAAAVAQARASSPRTVAAGHVVEGTREAFRTAGRLPNPLFELMTENWRPGARTSTPGLDVFAVVTQPLELGGKRALRRQLAASEYQLAEGVRLALERQVAIDTVHAYVQALRARGLVEALEANRDGLSVLVGSVARRVEEGYTAEADVLKLRTEAARIEADIVRARLELDRSLAALAVAIGSSVAIDPAQIAEPPPVPVPAADTTLITARVAAHPQAQAAAAAADRARQLAAYERARRLPDPAVSGGYKRTSGIDTAVLGVTVSIPLFDRNDSAAARAAGLERSAAAERAAVVRQLDIETAALVRAAQTLAERASRTPRDLLAPAEEVRRSALSAFREGATDILKLIDAERVYVDVRRAAIDLRLEALLAAIEARLALGEEALP